MASPSAIRLGPDNFAGNLSGRQRSSKSRVLRVICGSAGQQGRTHVEVSRNVIQAIDVISIGVRCQQIVDRIQSAPPEVLGNHCFTNAAVVTLE